ncbi:MAG: N-acetylglucosamine-6-phosphate deacetylase [Spirochaetaceae bacterium]|nr:MAG: N-acetylglucosamine-6-phosphate deacetylase [Spirochaetaceae bacterium]
MKRFGVSAIDGQPITIEIRGNRIQTVERPRDQSGPEDEESGAFIISPGFVDLQVNGVEGHDYSSEALSKPDIDAICRAMAVRGTVKHTATIITGPQKQMLRSIAEIQRAHSRDKTVNRAVTGLHVEGPFISPEDGPRGAHPRQSVRLPDVSEYESWQEAADGNVQIVTVAPELPGALAFIERIAADGVIAAIGHTNAPPECIAEAVCAGARMSTHLGNGSSAMLPRLHNFLWEQLADDHLVAGIISDGVHLPESVLRVFARAKQVERLVLVSDIAPLAGMDPGEYRWGDTHVQVHDDGHLTVVGTPYFAGASAGQDTAITVFSRATGWPLSDVVRLCTSNPARLLGMAGYPHELQAGDSADLTIFRYDQRRHTVQVIETILGGEVLYRGELLPSDKSVLDHEGC